MKSEFLYGRRPVAEVLRAGRRTIKKLLITKKSATSPPVSSLLGLAQAQNVPVESVPRDQLDAHAQGGNHQGVVLQAERYPYTALDDILDHARDGNQPPLLLILDLIQDVQNVGTLLRTAEAVGAHGIIIQERRAAAITPAVVRASSGATEHLRVAQVTNLVGAMRSLKENDVWLAGLEAGQEATRYDRANFKGGLGLVVGSEGKGLRRLVRETCDFLVSLPMEGQIESLNAAVAGSVVLYAAWQARQVDQEE